MCVNRAAPFSGHLWVISRLTEVGVAWARHQASTASTDVVIADASCSIDTERHADQRSGDGDDNGRDATSMEGDNAPAAAARWLSETRSAHVLTTKLTAH